MALNPFVSVIVPTYNRPGPLCELLESLYRQTYPNFEIIIVNDNGRDVGFVGDLYPELDIKVMDMPVNSKHVAARNAGVAAASGEFVMLSDDDDFIVPSHLETMLQEIGDYDLAYSDVEIVEFRDGGTARIPVKRSLFAYEFDAVLMRGFSTFVPSGCLYRKDLHDRIGPFDEEVYHYWDWDFILRVAPDRIKRVPVAGTLYAFAAGGDNLSEALSAMEPYLDRLCEKHGLGKLPVKNFFLLLEDPVVKKREAASTVVWDGQPVVSRLAAYGNGVNKNG